MRIENSFILRSYFKGLSSLRQLILLSCAFVSACATQPSLTVQNVKGFVGAPDPVIQKAGQNVLENGGNAADAMAAMLFTGSAVLPSRMGLGAGGVCQVLDPSVGRVKTLHFMSLPTAEKSLVGIPGLARGVYALQNAYGVLRWNAVLSDAVHKATNGVSVSDQLARDILATPQLDSSWRTLKKGDILFQKDLAKTLRSVSRSGSGVLYKDETAQSLTAQGVEVSSDRLKSFRATWMDSMDVSWVKGKTYFVNPTYLSSDGYSIWKNLTNTTNFEKRAKGREKLEKLEKQSAENSRDFKGVGLFAGDDSGLNIVCTISMGRLFGNGQMMKEGFALADAVHREKDASYFMNVMQTNPDMTDVYWIGAGVGTFGLVDGLNMLEGTLMNDRQIDQQAIEQAKKLTQTRQEDLQNFVFWGCDKGYPNQPGSCEKGMNMISVLRKNN